MSKVWPVSSLNHSLLGHSDDAVVRVLHWILPGLNPFHVCIWGIYLPRQKSLDQMSQIWPVARLNNSFQHSLTLWLKVNVKVIKIDCLTPRKWKTKCFCLCSSLACRASDGAVVRALHCKLPGCGFESISYLFLWDVSLGSCPSFIYPRCDKCWGKMTLSSSVCIWRLIHIVDWLIYDQLLLTLDEDTYGCALYQKINTEWHRCWN